MRWYQRLYDWVERRVQLEGPIKDAVLHKVPRSTESWWYVFGSAALTILILQVLTGILLAIEYVPSAAEAWNSLQMLNHHITMGWFLRAMHGWGSNFMVAIVVLHMIQVFLFGAYKFPRELTWMVGVSTDGRAETGNRTKATRPISVMPIARKAVATGLRMKPCEMFMATCLRWRWWHSEPGPCDRWARSRRMSRGRGSPLARRRAGSAGD